ncbi:hypothetical protein EF917_09880 [Streptomyces sp. WAC00469]|nr:hypothetical protein EF917_09880 [Streptomyces sp. WAC00469]
MDGTRLLEETEAPTGTAGRHEHRRVMLQPEPVVRGSTLPGAAPRVRGPLTRGRTGRRRPPSVRRRRNVC